VAWAVVLVALSRFQVIRGHRFGGEHDVENPPLPSSVDASVI
jgi:hypothetical protein